MNFGMRNSHLKIAIQKFLTCDSPKDSRQKNRAKLGFTEFLFYRLANEYFTIEFSWFLLAANNRKNNRSAFLFRHSARVRKSGFWDSGVLDSFVVLLKFRI